MRHVYTFIQIFTCMLYMHTILKILLKSKNFVFVHFVACNMKNKVAEFDHIPRLFVYDITDTEKRILFIVNSIIL